MTDRELLELAAKAAGMLHMKYSPYGGLVKMIDPARPESTGSVGPYWNPLTDDGDALRLAVACFFVIDIGPVSVTVHENNGRHDIGFAWRGDDPYAATRRAIVRAAAEIGRQMEAEK